MSKSSMPSNPAAATASSFSVSTPLTETVAMRLAHQAGQLREVPGHPVGVAGRPVKYSNAPIAWPTAIPPPGSTRQPRSRARPISSVSSGK